MWKKEFREIIKPVAAILSVSIIVPILALFNVPLGRTFNMIAVVIYHVFTGVYGNIYLLSFVFLLGILVLWAANMLGFGVFKYEYKDKAFEYLFAFPFSKYRILGYKFFSRFAVLLFLVVLYEILAIIFFGPLRLLQGASYFLFDPLYFPIWALFFFLASFFIGLFEQKNWIAVVSLVTFLSTIFFSLAVRGVLFPGDGAAAGVDGSVTGSAFVVGTLTILAILGAAFFTVFKKFDIKSPAIHARRFAFLVLPPLLFLTVVSFVILVR